MNHNSTPVYSTNGGRIPPGQKPAASTPAGDGIVRLHRQTKGRKGAGVTLITGLNLPTPELKTLAKKLKQRCGAGGSIKAGIIEIQSSQRDTLKTLLQAEGFTVKLAGG